MAMATPSSVSLLRRMCLSSSSSMSMSSVLALPVAPAGVVSSVFAVRSYGRKANAAAPTPAAKAPAPEKKVPKQKREPSAYAKFVKAKFTSVRVRIVVCVVWFFFCHLFFSCILVRIASLFRGSWCFVFDDFCSHN